MPSPFYFEPIEFLHTSPDATPKLGKISQYKITYLISLSRAIMSNAAYGAQASVFGCSAVEIGHLGPINFTGYSPMERFILLITGFHSALVRGSEVDTTWAEPYRSEGKIIYGLMGANAGVRALVQLLNTVGMASQVSGCHGGSNIAFMIFPEKRFRYMVDNFRECERILLDILERKIRTRSVVYGRRARQQ